jgi:hypothetical protein
MFASEQTRAEVRAQAALPRRFTLRRLLDPPPAPPDRSQESR